MMPGGNLSEEQRLIVSQIRRFVDREVMPVASELEHKNQYPQALIDQMKEMGLFSCVIPQEYGGLGLSFTVYAAIVSELARGWMSLGGILNTHAIVSYMIAAYGAEEQKRRFLPVMATGEMRCGLTITEPNAGSDVQAIQTTARREGERYLLSGTKLFVSNGRHGRLFAVLCRTDPAAVPPHKGMSVLLVEKESTPGLTVTREIDKLGYKGIDTMEFVFQDAPVPAANLLGGVEGRGFGQTMSGLEVGRINVSARAIGVAQAAFEDAIRYAQRRHTFGVPIAQHQAIQLMLAEMATKIEAARLMTFAGAAKKDRDDRADLEVGMAKLFASETAQEVALAALRIHGGYGYTKEMRVERYYRDTPFMLIGEGTSEIQKLVIARNLLKLYPAD